MKWIRYSYLLSILGIGYLLYSFIWLKNFTDGSLHIPAWIALLCIPAPYLLQAIYFQHSSLRARQLSQQAYDKAMNQLVDCSIHIIYSAGDCRNEHETQMQASLQQVAEIYHCDVMISIIASDKQHLTVVKQGSNLLNVVLTTATQAHYEPETLNHIIACMVVLHDQGCDNGVNSPEEALPTRGFVAHTPGNPIVIAVLIFEDASEKLKQIDRFFQFSGSKSVITRAGQLKKILARENGEWLK